MAFLPSVPSGSSARPPAINLPPLTLALLAAMTVIHVGLALAPAEFERSVVVYFAFIPAAYLAEGWPFWSLLVAPFSYALLHGGLGHLVLNGVMLAVMGQVLERRLGPGRFLLLFAAGAAGGALVHFLIGGAPRVPLIGASAGVGGLYGAGLVLHHRGVYLGPNTRLLVALAGLFIIMNLLGLVLPILSDIAYAAHLGGFIAGALVAARLTPPRRA
jgi:membrane associated rhomboid family serine protease